MKAMNRLSSRDILKFAGRIEKEARARERKIDAAEAAIIVETAQQALRLAKKIGKNVQVWNRRAMPTAYRWSKWKYSQFVVTAQPNGWITLTIERVTGPANDKSFDGLECSVDGVKARDVLWMAGRQRQRTLRFDKEIIRAVEKCA